MYQHNFRFILIFSLIFFWGRFSAQKQCNTWYFGWGAGLDFNYCPPKFLEDGQLSTLEGCASISDSSGKLLFYTDGITVWNRQHKMMTNGNGLRGNYSSTQSALIVQKPRNQNIYYIFTVDTKPSAIDAGTFEWRWSEVDMSLQQGLGEVTRKNILIYGSSCEKLTAIRHCNLRDVWVVTHDWNSNNFRSVLVDSNGVSSNLIISSAGLIISGNIGNRIGEMKGSPEGKKLACAIEINMSRIQLFDFDNQTGMVSHPVIFPKLSNACYGLEFSPDGSKAYFSTATPAHIFQAKVDAGDSNAVIASTKIVATLSGTAAFGALQRGPDQKIYVALGYQKYLGVIQSPNEDAIHCNYEPVGVSLGSRSSSYGLPNFVNTYFKPVQPGFTSSTECLAITFHCPKGDGYEEAISCCWDFGDQLSPLNNFTGMNPTHLFSEAGYYHVKAKIKYKCRELEIVQAIQVYKPIPRPTSIDGKEKYCEHESPKLSATMPGAYKWSSGDTVKTIYPAPVNRNYSLTVTNTAGCTYTASKSLSVFPLPIVNARVQSIDKLTAQLYGEGAVIYEWIPVAGMSCVSCERPIAYYAGDEIYCVTGTDKNGCSSSACVEVKLSTVYVPDCFTPNKDQLNDIFLPVVREVSEFKLQIFNRWGEKLFTSENAAVGWDGKWKGEDCEEDIYVFTLHAKQNTDHKVIDLAGKLMLLR